jgi:hypothetical protein
VQPVRSKPKPTLNFQESLPDLDSLTDPDSLIPTLLIAEPQKAKKLIRKITAGHRKKNDPFRMRLAHEW